MLANAIHDTLNFALNFVNVTGSVRPQGRLARVCNYKLWLPCREPYVGGPIPRRIQDRSEPIEA